MRRYVIATHGHMASGIRSTLEIIVGPQENLICIDAYTEECPDPLPEFEKILNGYPEDEIVIMTDMFGGSVNNNAMALLGRSNVHVITGISLATVISVIMSDPEEETKNCLNAAVEEAKNMMMYCEQVQDLSGEDDF